MKDRQLEVAPSTREIFHCTQAAQFYVSVEGKKSFYIIEFHNSSYFSKCVNPPGLK